MKYSIVTTLYKSENTIKDFCYAIADNLKLLTQDYEIIIVNDGSPDNSLASALLLQKDINNITILDLTRNYGHHTALWVGLEYATGDRIFMIDSDLEINPKNMIKFDTVMKDCNADLVYGYAKDRKGSFSSRVLGGVYYSIFNLFNSIKLTKNTVSLRLMTREFLDCLMLHKETEISLGGLINQTGCNQIGVEVDKRYKGYTSYSFIKRLSQSYNGLISFSTKPLYFIFFLGIVLSVSAVFYIIYLGLILLFGGFSVPGYLTIIASIWLFGGGIILSVGVVSLYLAKIFNEVKGRPIAVIKSIYKG